MWSKIENAPKDRPILGYRDGKISVIEWTDYKKTENYWILQDGSGWKPEFWMELPDAPNETDLQWRWPTYKEVKEKVDTPLELKEMALDAMLTLAKFNDSEWDCGDCVATYHEILKALRES